MQTYFIDMDGSLAEWRDDGASHIYQQGYFANLNPNQNIVTAIKKLVELSQKSKRFRVKVLSSYLEDSAYALKEKRWWLEEYLPEISEHDWIFVPYGMNKQEVASKYITNNNDVLVDDYGKNLNEWKGKKVKVSRNLLDSQNERQKYKHVISPEHDPLEICLELLLAAN